MTVRLGLLWGTLLLKIIQCVCEMKTSLSVLGCICYICRSKVILRTKGSALVCLQLGGRKWGLAWLPGVGVKDEIRFQS